MSAEQLTFGWDDTVRLTRHNRHHALTTTGGGWMAVNYGGRWGWVFYRANHTTWETYELDLPYGQTALYGYDEAETMMRTLIGQHGDDPGWLDRWARRRALTLVGA